MTRRSRAMESFSRFLVATAGALAVMGAVAFIFASFDGGLCSGSTGCRPGAVLHR